MRPIPEIMTDPAAVSTIQHYRDQFLTHMSRAGKAAEAANPASVTATLLCAAFGALDASLCSFISFHTGDGSAFDADQFYELVKARVAECQALVERETCEGGVQ